MKETLELSPRKYSVSVQHPLECGRKLTAGTPKFFAKNLSWCVPNQSVIRKVSFSEKLPSSKTRRNSQPSSNPWIECGMPAESSINRRRHIIHEIAPLGINRGNPCLSRKHIGPFVFLMPMHFTNPSRLQTHIHTCKGRCNWQFADGHFSGPASCRQAISRC